MCVVYFDQGLGASHSKRWWKYVISCFLHEKSKKVSKKRKNMQNEGKIMFGPAPKIWSRENTFVQATRLHKFTVFVHLLVLFCV